MIASVLVFSPFLSSSEIILPNEHVSMVKSAFSWPDSILLPDLFYDHGYVFNLITLMAFRSRSTLGPCAAHSTDRVIGASS